MAGFLDKMDLPCLHQAEETSSTRVVFFFFGLSLQSGTVGVEGSFEFCQTALILPAGQSYSVTTDAHFSSFAHV